MNIILSNEQRINEVSSITILSPLSEKEIIRIQDLTVESTKKPFLCPNCNHPVKLEKVTIKKGKEKGKSFWYYECENCGIKDFDI